MSGLEFEILPSESSQPESELKTELTPRAYSLTRLADVKPERPLWLRLGHIPKGKIVLIDGDPATGKSTLALDIAAHVTTGTVWPDGRRVSLPTQQTCTTNSSTPRNCMSSSVREACGPAKPVARWLGESANSS